MLVELAHETGLNPKKASSSEFHSPCPTCNGTNRFIIWPGKNRYWCRQCKKSGDAIQFCKDFMGMSFREACERIGDKGTYKSFIIPDKQQPLLLPAKSWEDKASQFVESCHQRLLIDHAALSALRERNLSMETVQKYLIGLNPVTLFPRREVWGLPKKIENGKEKKLCIPAGFTIPTYQDQSLCKIKIRRNEWKVGDSFGKYYVVPGSLDLIPIFGNASIPVVVVVEAEFDAMLVVQEAGDLCCCIALGGAQKRPDAYMKKWLQERELIIFALDFDEAGKKEYPYWHSNYLNLRAWPVPMGKSPEEACRLGINLRDWIALGVS